MKNSNIRLGNGFTQKYLNPNNFISIEIEAKNGFVKSYQILNKPNSPIFGGVLNIMEDGRAIFDANFTTYSGVKNEYSNYFNNEGLEIIHKNDSTIIEKKYFDSL